MTEDSEAPIDRHDLQALKDWINAKFDTVGATLHGMDEAIKVASEERQKKDQELNDVRTRFIPRETFDTLDKRVDELERGKASTEAVNAYKRIVFAAGATGLVALAIAIFNYARTPGG